VKFTSIYIL